MHLKTLTLKGFKSFASATTLQFEPGVTAVVGPNGSGKSNVVDALSWVMGEQGAKSLRGGKMEDVIFAGTSGRPPLGRAEVSLTIDNSDGALPIDYTEVTISRIMFRSGGSDYAINGSPCRLLDIQELLSDSGIGREMHVIVGQGQLDSILHATPEDRRGFIEEAAGVLKHRKRKEKALRKMDALGDKLSRLHDLSTELRRQLKPLGRQAEVARRAVVIQADLRDARLRLLADDYVSAKTSLDAEVADEEALLHKRSELEADLLRHRAREAEVAAEQEAAAPLAAAAEQVWSTLAQVVERLRAIAGIAADRIDIMAAAASPATAQDPEELTAEADEAAGQEEDLRQVVAGHQGSLQVAISERAQLEETVAAQDRELTLARQRRDQCQAEVRRWSGRKAAAETAAAGRRAELARAQQAHVAAEQELAVAREQAAQQPMAGGQLDEQSHPLRLELAAAQERHQTAVAAVQQARSVHQDRQRAATSAIAKAETLANALHAGEQEAATVIDAAGLTVRGIVSDLITTRPGSEQAVAAALGVLADGVVVADLADAVAGLSAIRAAGVDEAHLLIAQPASTAPDSDATLLASHVLGEDQVAAAARTVLADVVLVESLTKAAEVVLERPDVITVTPEGDVVSGTWVRGGVRDGSARLRLRLQAEEAADAAQSLAKAADQADQDLQEHLATEARLAADVEQARAAWHDERARAAADQERQSHLARQLRTAEKTHHDAGQRVETLTKQLASDEEALVAATDALVQSEEILAAAGEPDADARSDLSGRLAIARQTETEARLALRTAEERASAAADRVAQLRAAAQQARIARQRAERDDRVRRFRAQVATEVLRVAQEAQGQADRAFAEATQRRTELRGAEAARKDELNSLRLQIRELEAEIARVTDSVHRDEVARAEQRLRIEQIAEKALTEHGVSADELVGEYGPDVLVPPSAVAPGDEVDPAAPPPQPYPFDRQEQERRLQSAQRSMTLLGKVNPLALEEFSALEERYTYLNEQVEDMKRTKADLLGIVRDVDARVEQVFAEAFADAAVHFEQVFARLFPGGAGRLILTDPKDLLNTGVDVEARPPGKKVKRLSLLSGGERSLTAVAFLVALFKARPSPFYVLDEVEAALDDTNLGRLIDVIEELRQTSQLIVITHQKRTMEAADALYGVSMRGDGVTQVISQRLREREVIDLTDQSGSGGGQSGDSLEEVGKRGLGVGDTST